MMDLNPVAQKAIVQIIGGDCFKNIEFSENIRLSTRFTLLVDSLTEYEYAFEHTIDRYILHFTYNIGTSGCANILLN